jgi:two-component system nitrogen regulation sensor histidine kinase NtrY
MTLRTRLILIFVAATVVPLVATWWLTTSLLEQSLAYSSTDQLDRLSRITEQTGRELYQHARDSLKADAVSGRQAPQRYRAASPAAWPAQIRAFWESGEPEGFALSEPEGDRINYFRRDSDDVLAWSAPVGSLGMTRISDAFREARETVEQSRSRDLRRGFVYTYVLLAASVWFVSLVLLALMAHRYSRPIRRLTAGLDRLTTGDFSVRLETDRADETGRAIRAFNDMASQLQQNRDRLVYLAQLASWQLLARKMAHELKNSLTPIRLTLEEIVARNPGDSFIEQAARIVVDEVESLEHRVRAFSEFASEPPVSITSVSVNNVTEERIAFLKTGHPEVAYNVLLSGADPVALADEDLLKGILSNLLENAAEAAGPGGTVLATTAIEDGHVAIEIHDSGSGLTGEARQSLFEPTISFKKRGMGLGLSIARKNALLMGGDIALAAGALSGAAFRITLPQPPPALSYQLSEQRDAGASVSPQSTQRSPGRHLVADS